MTATSQLTPKQKSFILLEIEFDRRNVSTITLTHMCRKHNIFRQRLVSQSGKGDIGYSLPSKVVNTVKNLVHLVHLYDMNIKMNVKIKSRYSFKILDVHLQYSSKMLI